MKIDIGIYLAVGETLLIFFDRIIVTVNPKILALHPTGGSKLDISTDVNPVCRSPVNRRD